MHIQNFYLNYRQMSELNPKQILQQYENTSPTMQMIEQKFKFINQSIAQKINCKKVQQYCDRKLDAKKRQIVNQICQTVSSKVQPILDRQVNKALKEYRIHDNIKIFDYIVARQKILSQIGQQQTEPYDEEQEYLEDFKNTLTQYYNRM